MSTFFTFLSHSFSEISEHVYNRETISLIKYIFLYYLFYKLYIILYVNKLEIMPRVTIYIKV